ncbi:MAG: CoA-binding protein [Candidatus Thermoplasmatota archaeon]|jgi:acetyltransferase|nr:CoA-binding protein [Candidatus Thermoplasmatota archaeon]MDP7264588.1 CoA-binding protein [Candidatus Thermoplasmatota archaeon]
MGSIEYFFKPRSVAVIGASQAEGKIGNIVLKNIIFGSKDNAQMGVQNGFKGNIFPINPQAEEVCGLKAYGSILDVPTDVDMAVICIPAKAVKRSIEECGTKGVLSVVIITAGFSEGGEDSKNLENEILDIASQYSIRIIGPNCLGVISTYSALNASFGDAMPNKGPISFVSQSGALCTSVINYSFEEHLGFSNFVSIGNKSDVDDADLLDYFSGDESTKCIMFYIESLKDARKFFDTSRRVVRDKPVVAFKSGYTEEGAKATSSHTGSIAGSDVAYVAAFKQSGVFRAKTLSQLFDSSRALAYQPVPHGENIAILTNAGGPGVLASDTAYSLGMALAELSEDTVEKLNQVCPPTWSHRNPVDIIGDATAERYEESLKILMSAREIDGVILLLSPTARAEPMDIAIRTVDVQKESGKPVTASFVGMVSQESENYLDSNGIPEIEYPERAVFAMYALIHRMRFLKKEGLM